MARKPFLVMGDHPSPITRTQFRRMSREAQREVMLEWFAANYEDPAERTPYESREGGYQWIWGGPYDASEEIRDQFEGLTSEKVIFEVIDEIQKDGLIEWAPTPRQSDYDEDTPIEEDKDIDPLDALPDEAGPFLGSREEMAARKEAVDAIERFERLIKEKPAGIGHNNPPEDARTLPPEEVAIAVSELKVELKTSRPKIYLAKSLLRTIGTIFGGSARWVGGRVNVVVDETLKMVVKIGITAPFLAMEPNIQIGLINIYQSAMKWIAEATRYF